MCLLLSATCHPFSMLGVATARERRIQNIFQENQPIPTERQCQERALIVFSLPLKGGNNAHLPSSPKKTSSLKPVTALIPFEKSSPRGNEILKHNALSPSSSSLRGVLYQISCQLQNLYINQTLRGAHMPLLPLSSKCVDPRFKPTIRSRFWN